MHHNWELQAGASKVPGHFLHCSRLRQLATMAYGCAMVWLRALVARHQSTGRSV